MENRFGVKDLFLFLLLVVLIVSVWLAMKQFDLQKEHVLSIRARLDDQSRELRDIQDRLRRGVVSIGTPNGLATTQSTDTAAIDPKDPFGRIKAAQAMPGYARGDWLVEVFGGEVARLTPLLAGDSYAATVHNYVLESLAIRDPETLEWRPLLSTDWTITDNTAAYDKFVEEQKKAGKTEEEIAKNPDVPVPILITFTLRPDVRFSDGAPLTADDVVFTFDFIMNQAIAAPRARAYFEKIRSVQKKGENQVVFRYKEPYFEAFELAATMEVMPKHFYGKYLTDPEKFNVSVGLLLGSGPYRLESATEWKPGSSRIILVRNERYWGELPAFDRMVFNSISSDVARVTAFRNGDIDFIGLSPEQYREMLTDAALVRRTRQFEYLSPSGGYRYVAWNQVRQGQPTHFADKRVRQAMAMLINRDRLVLEVMLGYAEPTSGPFSPLSKQYDKTVKPWPYDVKRARALLGEAGFKDQNGDGILDGPDGRPFRFKLTYPSGSSNYENMVLAMKDAYARAGIVLDPDPLEWAVFTQRIENKDFEAISLGWTSGIETDIYQMFDSSQMLAGGDNYMSYKNEELDRVIRKARSSVQEEKRMPLWHRAHQILNEDQPYMFLWFGKSLVFLDERVENAKRVKMGLSPRMEWFVPREKQRWTR